MLKIVKPQLNLMPIIIGGCGGSGTSLLRQVLNRHSQVYIAPETHVFAKNRIYRDWESAKSQLTKRSIFGLRTSGMTMFTGFDLKHSDFKNTELPAISTDDFSAFSEELFVEPMRQHGKVIWGEKTPNNAYHFPDILDQVPDAKCIMMIRDPYDNIASLVSRGYSISHAVSRYLMTNAFGIRTNGKTDRIIRLKYEDLVTQPKQTLEKLMKRLGLDFQDGMLLPGKASEDDGTKMHGWKLDESEKIQSNAVNRFEESAEDIKARIQRAVYKLRVREDLKEKFNLATNVKCVAKKLGYKYRGKGELKDDCKWISRELTKVKLNRSIRGYNQPFNQFPVHIK